MLRWTVVRAVGELQVLTRISYATLAVVPLIAGLWQVIRALLAQQGRAVAEAKAGLDASASGLARERVLLSSAIERHATSTRAELLEVSSEAAERVQSINAGISRLYDVLNSAALDAGAFVHAPMPSTLAVGFFAALSMAIGHLIYQWKCPAEIRSYKQQEFSEMLLQRYKENKFEYMVLDARMYSRALRDQADEFMDKDYMAMIKSAPEEMRNRMMYFDDQYTSKITKPTDPDDIFRAELAMMDQAHEIFYFVKSKESRHYIFAVLGLFAIGLTLIFIATVDQAIAVGEAAGWLDCGWRLLLARRTC